MTPSLRDYFAARVAAGLESNMGANDWTPQKIALRSYRIADALIVERNKV